MSEPVFDEPSDDRVQHSLRAWGSIGALALGPMAGACAHPSLPCELELEPGDLVITEIRGPQQGPDSRGEWFELHNPTAEAIDLYGLRGVLVNLKGSLEIGFLVRESVVVEPGGYAVLGSLANSPPEVDYSFNGDFVVNPGVEDTDGTLVIPTNEDSDPRALFSNARVQLFACERLIDAVVYAELPPMGTYSFDGRIPPDADDNDDVARWCTDATEAPTDGPQTEVGLPGSPGEANRPCP